MAFVYKPVTNNVVDVFYGQEGFDKKEHARFKRGQGTWNMLKIQKKIHEDEHLYQKIVRVEDVLPEIIEYLKKNMSSKKAS